MMPGYGHGDGRIHDDGGHAHHGCDHARHGHGHGRIGWGELHWSDGHGRYQHDYALNTPYDHRQRAATIRPSERHGLHDGHGDHGRLLKAGYLPALRDHAGAMGWCRP